MRGKTAWSRAAAVLPVLLVLAALGASPAAAQTLNFYCSMPEEWCRAMVNAFTRDTGIQISMIRKSSGEMYAQVRAEAGRPRGDIWWGGTGDVHLQAAGEGHTEPYTSPMLDQLRPWALEPWKATGGRTVGITAGILGFVYNTEVLARLKAPEPRCWADLVKPEYKGEVQISHPASAGTGYAALATFVQLMGEDAAFAYLKKLDANVSQYTVSGDAPATSAARGETLIAVVFIQAAIPLIMDKFPLKIVAPCEGTTMETPSMSLIKGGPNPGIAKRFYDWALTAPAQELAATVRAFHALSNRDARLPPGAPDMTGFKIIDYDSAKFGLPETRQRLLARREAELGKR